LVVVVVVVVELLLSRCERNVITEYLCALVRDIQRLAFSVGFLFNGVGTRRFMLVHLRADVRSETNWNSLIVADRVI